MAYQFGQAQQNLKQSGQIRPDMGQLQQGAQQAEVEAGTSVGRRFLSELPKQAYQTIAGNIPKFLTSAAAAPIDIARGVTGKEPMQGTAKFPGLEPFQTFQAGAARKFEGLAQGQGSDVKAGLSMAGELAKTPLAGMETGGMASIMKKTPQMIIATGRLFSKTADKKAIQNALEVILPKKMTPTELEKRVKQGQVAYKGFITKTAEPVASKFEKTIAGTIKGIVNPKLTPDKNINALKSTIKDISENQVVPNLEANPQIFNNATLQSKLNAIEPPILLKSNTTLQNTYKAVVDTAMQIVAKGKHNMKGLWDSRKVLDDIADEAKLLDFDSRQVAAKAVRDVRKVINQFIIDEIPNGQKLYGEPMKQMSDMYRAIDMIADNTPSKIISHPKLAAGYKWLKRIAVGYGLIKGYQAID